MEQKTLWTEQLCEHLWALHHGKPKRKGLVPPLKTKARPHQGSGFCTLGLNLTFILFPTHHKGSICLLYSFAVSQ